MDCLKPPRQSGYEDLDNPSELRSTTDRNTMSASGSGSASVSASTRSRGEILQANGHLTSPRGDAGTSRLTTPSHPVSFLLPPDTMTSDVSGTMRHCPAPSPANMGVGDIAVVPKRKTEGSTNGGGVKGRKSRNMEDILKTDDLLQDGKNVLCPICNGIGKIPKEEEKHRVALIAADDERLKPSRTLCYVAAAVVLTVILAFLMMFFLYPRSFTISQRIGKDYCGPKLYPYSLTINTADNFVDIKVTNYWELENPNYYPIQLVSLNVQVYHDKLLKEASNNTSVPVSLKTTKRIFMDLPITIQGDLGLVKFCADKRSWVHIILIKSQVTAVVNIMGYNFTSITVTYQKVSCGFEDTTTTKPNMGYSKALENIGLKYVTFLNF